MGYLLRKQQRTSKFSSVNCPLTSKCLGKSCQISSQKRALESRSGQKIQKVKFGGVF